MNKFGIFAQNLRVKVTQPPQNLDRVSFVNCQMGFKNSQTGVWSNEWVKLKVFAPHLQTAQQIQKDMRLEVSGRMVLESREYQGQEKKEWVILIGEDGGLQIQGRTESTSSPQQNSHFPSSASDIGEVPF